MRYRYYHTSGLEHHKNAEVFTGKVTLAPECEVVLARDLPLDCELLQSGQGSKTPAAHSVVDTGTDCHDN